MANHIQVINMHRPVFEDLVSMGYRPEKFEPYEEFSNVVPRGEVQLREWMRGSGELMHMFVRPIIWVHSMTKETIFTPDYVYRLHISKDGDITVTTYGFENNESELEPFYDSVDSLPEWVQSKLAMLMMFPSENMSFPDVPKVGWRIAKNVFWIYPDKL